ncbi:cupredoxin domain-containing protein [Patescibacteria group bacterium]|nr:cupredoxin domain-containing protein [Patescibacteria group bacterium]
MKKSTTWIIVIIIILVVLAIILLSTPKAGAPEGTIPEASGEETVMPGEGEEKEMEGEADVLQGAEQVVPDASPVSDKGEVLTSEGVPVDNTALPGSPEAPKQSRALDETEIPASAVKLTVTANGFSPSEFTVKPGQAVTLSVTSGDKTHVFKFDDNALQAVAVGVAGGETRAITFNAPTAGDYTFYCDVPGHRGRGETGVMHVK